MHGSYTKLYATLIKKTYAPLADLDVFPDLEEVEEYPEEGDDEAGDHHEEEPVVVSQPEGDQAREPA